MADEYISVMDPRDRGNTQKRALLAGLLSNVIDAPSGIAQSGLLSPLSMVNPAAKALLTVAQKPASDYVSRPDTRTPTDQAAFDTGSALGAVPLVGASRSLLGITRQADVLSGLQASKIGGSVSSRSASILDPKPLPQRAFHDDYPGMAGVPAERLATSIEGVPLTAKYIAGRRIFGGADEGLGTGAADGIASDRGLRVTFANRSGPELNGDYGAFDRGWRREIFLDKSLAPEKQSRVLAHEVAHSIDEDVKAVIGAKGSRIPTDKLEKELHAIYEDLNTNRFFKRGNGAKPKDFGYKPNEAGAELMAEAIRAYMMDPNYIKSIAPKTAARIRQYVNTNPELNRTIQFNSAGGLAAGGLLGIDPERK